jgi:hypothetical protein
VVVIGNVVVNSAVGEIVPIEKKTIVARTAPYHGEWCSQAGKRRRRAACLLSRRRGGGAELWRKQGKSSGKVVEEMWRKQRKSGESRGRGGAEKLWRKLWKSCGRG